MKEEVGLIQVEEDQQNYLMKEEVGLIRVEEDQQSR